MSELLNFLGILAAAFFGSSWIGEIVKGKYSNKDVAERLDAITKKMAENDKNLNSRIDALDYKIDKNDAETRRQRIIRISKEAKASPPDDEELDTAIEDIDAYENFCDKHHNFENGKAVRAIKNIRYLDEMRRKNEFNSIS